MAWKQTIPEDIDGLFEKLVPFNISIDDLIATRQYLENEQYDIGKMKDDMSDRQHSDLKKFFQNSTESGQKLFDIIDDIICSKTDGTCFCAKRVSKIEAKKVSTCSVCLKTYEEGTTDFYACSPSSECLFSQITQLNIYYICSSCKVSIRQRVDPQTFSHAPNTMFVFDKLMLSIDMIRDNINDIGDDVHKLKKYMFRVNLSFYQMCLVKLAETTFQNTGFDTKINTLYDSLHTEAMNKIRDLTDLNKLKLDKSIFVNQENMKNIQNKKQMDKINQFALDWKHLNDEIKEEDDGTKIECRFKKICGAKQRLFFVDRLFKRNFTVSLKCDFFIIFEHSLADYSAVDLLNDLHHFESFHADEFYECQCNTAELIRVEREKEEKSNLDSLCDEHRNILDLTLKAHQFIKHREILKDEDDAKQSEIRPLQWRQQKENDQKYQKNKFVQEMIACEEMENEKDEKEQRMDDLMKELIEKGMAQDKAKKFMNYLEVHDYDSDSIRFDLEQRGMFNKMDQSNLFNELHQNKYFIKIIKNYFKIKGNDNDKIAVFNFGEENTFGSYEYYKGGPYFVVPKYTNLKEELLKNGIFEMDIKSFHRQLLKAHMFASSKKAKALKARDHSGNNEMFEVPPFCPISVAHILCALIYCNCTNVQYEFKKFGTRRNKNCQTVNELKQFNAEISHWYCLLFECVWFYGSGAKENQIFYTGLNIPMLFDSFLPRFCAPISTTVDRIIATSFSKTTGVILELKQGSGRPADYFDVEWLSDYPNERERLFFGADTLRIADICTFHDGVRFSNDECIKAMTLFSSLFSGHYLLDMCNKRTQRLLCALIQNFNANNNIESKGPIRKKQFSLFMEQMFYNLVSKMDKYLVIKQEYEKLSDVLKDELFSIKGDDVVQSPFMEHLMKTSMALRGLLTPNLIPTLEVNGQKYNLTPDIQVSKSNIEFMEEYIWILTGPELNVLKYGRKDTFIFSDSFYYDLTNDERVEFKFGLRKVSSLKRTGFVLVCNTPKAVTGEYSLCVDDFKYSQNPYLFSVEPPGRLVQVICFDQKYLDKVSDSLALRVAVRFKLPFNKPECCIL